MLAPGERLGPYEILSPLGVGGMGEVYRARDPRLGREVAIKVLPASFSQDPDRLRRFEQEARAAGVLNHPNLTALHDIGTHEGAPYVVQELLEGETLRSVLAEGRLSPRKAIEYALQIAHGLAAAHEKGIVHRDLKPENLFVTRDGRVKILDFGLAKLTQEQDGSQITNLPTAGTEPGVVLGTLGYMSPEQVRGKPADGRSDIFSFGAILYEMLSGKRAFHGDSAADTVTAILKEDPPDLSPTNRSVSSGLERIVRHCLEKNPEERFQSARDLGFDLSVVAGQSATTAVGSPRRANLLWVRAALAALLVVATALLWRTRQANPKAPSVFDRRSIAVLPFQNLSPDPENAYFADGMTEDILTQLAKIRELKVISRSSVMPYKGTKKPIRTVAAELGVATILEGSVRRAGNRVRIVGQLIDAGTDQHLWAETYDRDLKDVFAIQGEVAQQIAAALRATLSPAEKKRIGQVPTQNLAAYSDYLKGRESYYRFRRADNEAAIAFFRKSLESDPEFSLGYAGLGDAYAQGVQRLWYPQSWLQSGLDASRRAIALDPDLSEGHKALGLAYFVRGAYRESLEEGKHAAEINPNLAAATAMVGATLRLLGRLDESLPWSLRGSELDPKNAVSTALVGSGYAALADERHAERWYRLSLQLQSDLGQAHANLIYLYLRQRRDEEARRQARSAVALSPKDPWAMNAVAVAELLTGDPTRAQRFFEEVFDSTLRGTRVGSRNAGAGVETHLAYLHLRVGARPEAEALLRESLATDQRLASEGNQDWGVPFDMACVDALRGEKNSALRWLDQAIEAGWRGWPLGTRSPLLDSLRSDPRFQRIEIRLETLVSEMRRRAGLR